MTDYETANVPMNSEIAVVIAFGLGVLVGMYPREAAMLLHALRDKQGNKDKRKQKKRSKTRKK